MFIRSNDIREVEDCLLCFVYLRRNEIFPTLRPILGEHSLWSVLQLLHT
jgi:hypothetical protein